MFAFVFNSYLTLALEWPKIFELFYMNNELTSLDYFKIFIEIFVYFISIAGVFYLSYIYRDQSLRKDCLLLNKTVNYFIRSCFWAVVFVGLADVIISFLRVEDLLDNVVGQDLATQLGRSKFRGPYVHIPLVFLGFFVGIFIKHIAFTWLAFLVVIAELLIVITRFVFSYEQAFQGDIVRFWYAALFLFASAYTLFEDGHVRVDVLYSKFTSKTKGIVNSYGSVLMGMTLCWCILLLGMWEKTNVIVNPMLSYESAQSGFGMYTKYWLASFLAIFAISMMIQFSSYLFESYADYKNEDGKREIQDNLSH
ncbi:TRAP transporter small permease subunit [Alphaproteobacteria bacterium]|jgi:TRAP-type mannitol/chloroaromatic compound transport system permease small subunit|nr:TRAP transporter small permease subunit [Alphaproteobacteria bacterium]MDB2584232.1 TRAP transporter small permease subunit [Alphaproteobacteria bacterium]MDC3410182.1 TRAP transporter small permease subunit [Alphaproteobacteria bacterium]